MAAELEKRVQAFEMSCYRSASNMSYKDHVTCTNEAVRTKIQSAIGEYDGQETGLNVFWLSKDNSTGHSKREKKKR